MIFYPTDGDGSDLYKSWVYKRYRTRLVLYNNNFFYTFWLQLWGSKFVRPFRTYL